jgi:Zn-dependent protease with chaperone function
MGKYGPGIFFDGKTSARQHVEVEVLAAELEIRSAQGRLLTLWPYTELEHLAAPEHVLRLGLYRNPVLARLEVHDPVLAHAIDEKSLSVDRTGAIGRRARLRVVAWSAAAMVVLVLAAVFGVPALASRLAPLVPPALERKLGNAVDAEVRGMLDTRNLGGAFECGQGDAERPGRTALDRLTNRLAAAADLAVPLQLAVVRRPETNAIALPGGRIYVFQGLIAKAETADELAGVIAHEIGHVARRDGTRSILQGAGLSFLFGMLLGDFVGGGAVMVAATTVLRSSYSRDVERAADAYAVELAGKAGADPQALARMLARIADDKGRGPKILLDHPEAAERIAAINAMPRAAAPPTPLLDAGEWAALKRVCDGRS